MPEGQRSGLELDFRSSPQLRGLAFLTVLSQSLLWAGAMSQRQSYNCLSDYHDRSLNWQTSISSHAMQWREVGIGRRFSRSLLLPGLTFLALPFQSGRGIISNMARVIVIVTPSHIWSNLVKLGLGWGRDQTIREVNIWTCLQNHHQLRRISPSATSFLHLPKWTGS